MSHTANNFVVVVVVQCFTNNVFLQKLARLPEKLDYIRVKHSGLLELKHLFTTVSV